MLTAIESKCSRPGDDLFKQIDTLFFSGSPFGAVDVIGVVASVSLAIVLAFATYAVGAAWAGGFREGVRG